MHVSNGFVISTRGLSKTYGGVNALQSRGVLRRFLRTD